MNSCMNATSITDLKQQQAFEEAMKYQNMQYGAGQNLQYEQGHNTNHNIMQGQQNPYYSMGINYPEFINPSEGEMGQAMPRMPSPEVQIREAPQEFVNIPQVELNISEERIINGEDKKRKDQDKLISIVPKVLREPLIVFIVFFILSLPYIRNGIGSYIPQINPDVTGNVTYVGIAIYGLILIGFAYALKNILHRF